ncbi:MAG: glycosidase [Ferruginibacter sp.]|uniref:alpha-amylase family glycosyl hydrolase n=1 Tax=Ferruginibacter sp. TaxID=1940288 RepID=UPI002657C270|nr:alpha-amylase family glycosyl hydrolase [Ferruginibacter sp.]MDB5277648.1 glycosidase [Ferruginibacter sp.]
MGVMMQAFYWDCPRLENKEFEWWNFINEKTAELSKAGFSALWLPPACKAANLGGLSMGYDPYDYYDLGDINQKGSVPTWFGTRNDLEKLIKAIHQNGMQVYADMVLNHTSGADEEEVNLFDGQKRWTKYDPGSGKFSRDWSCYHPSYFERWDGEVFEGMPDLCHHNPYVYSELMEYARWVIEDIGFDGLRYDFVKGYGGWMISAILDRLYKKNGETNFSPFGVGEYWDSDGNISEWLRETNVFTDNPVAAFDFPLRGRLKSLCDSYGFSLQTLTQAGTLLTDGTASCAVTFVENHDIIRQDPIVSDKILAYAYILTHEGYPCVFWQDYFNYGLARTGSKNGIEALVAIHELYAGGKTAILYCDNDLYIMQRHGNAQQKGLVFVLNNSGRWNGRQVNTQWAQTKFIPEAFCGNDDAAGLPIAKWSDGYGNADFWAPPRGYVVYVPAAD